MSWANRCVGIATTNSSGRPADGIIRKRWWPRRLKTIDPTLDPTCTPSASRLSFIGRHRITKTTTDSDPQWFRSSSSLHNKLLLKKNISPPGVLYTSQKEMTLFFLYTALNFCFAFFYNCVVHLANNKKLKIKKLFLSTAAPFFFLAFHPAVYSLQVKTNHQETTTWSARHSWAIRLPHRHWYAPQQQQLSLRKLECHRLIRFYFGAEKYLWPWWIIHERKVFLYII